MKCAADRYRKINRMFHYILYIFTIRKYIHYMYISLYVYVHYMVMQYLLAII